MSRSLRYSIDSLFGCIEDPRDPTRCHYRLSDLLFISFCTLLANGEDFVDMEEFARQRFEWLSKHIDLSLGIPSHDTFNRVFRMLSVEGLRACLAADGHRLLDHL